LRSMFRVCARASPSPTPERLPERMRQTCQHASTSARGRAYMGISYSGRCTCIRRPPREPLRRDGAFTVGISVGTTPSNCGYRGASVSKSHTGRVSANRLNVSSLKKILTILSNRDKNPPNRFLLLRRQVLYPPELRARVPFTHSKVLHLPGGSSSAALLASSESLLEHLGVPSTKKLRDPFIRYAAGTEPVA
jgi:hypothetical protein